MNSARAALSLISDHDISHDTLISRFIKGASKQRPSAPKYDSTWDVDSVLEAVAKWYPPESLSLKQLSLKLVLLLALATSHRLQTLAAIKIDNIVEKNEDIEIKIPTHLKTTRRKGAIQPTLRLPFFRERAELCVAQTLKFYLSKTSILRNSQKNLLISYVKPHGAVKEDTIGRWIKSALHQCGVEEQYTAHSTRHAATSKAAAQGVSIEEIHRVAGWSAKSKVFADFYCRPVKINENKFARTVLNPEK